LGERRTFVERVGRRPEALHLHAERGPLLGIEDAGTTLRRDPASGPASTTDLEYGRIPTRRGASLSVCSPMAYARWNAPVPAWRATFRAGLAGRAWLWHARGCRARWNLPERASTPTKDGQPETSVPCVSLGATQMGGTGPWSRRCGRRVRLRHPSPEWALGSGSPRGDREQGILHDDPIPQRLTGFGASR